MKIKKALLMLVSSAAMVVGMMPGMNMNVQAQDNSTEYTITIPATLTVSQNGWNATDGITAQVKSGDTFDTSKKLTVTAASTNSWALKSGNNSVGYNLATATGTYSSTATPASWEFSATELNETNGTNKPMGIIVEDYSSKPAGTYQDTVTFTASVETAVKQHYTLTITVPDFSRINMTIEFYEGDTWADMCTKYPDSFEIWGDYIGYKSWGYLQINAEANVKPSDQINPNASYGCW